MKLSSIFFLTAIVNAGSILPGYEGTLNDVSLFIQQASKQDLAIAGSIIKDVLSSVSHEGDSSSGAIIIDTNTLIDIINHAEDEYAKRDQQEGNIEKRGILGFLFGLSFLQLLGISSSVGRY
ncbi:Ubiquitin-activating enzyme, putative [Candida maltosa Xu316]|uniref:Ubiquitin-activating enzyme, putative n=1 Tax=Candida maltosa (strain Xu316) TaxID=1245528 RepID=M3JCH4_CANMX|nr:Ubiquitin-activating enzyme, putative [Candida maltosa Xu316]